MEAASTKDKGLYVDTAALHYGVSSVLAAPFDPAEGLVLQYEATTQDGLDCGGAYLKFITADEDFSPEALDGDTPYTVMFGPDKCGATNKVHVIFRHKSPLDGSVEEKHLKNPPAMPADSLPHLYTLVVKPDNTFEVRVDGDVKSTGSLFDEFEPPFNPPAEIDDETDKKPEDWVDEAKIDDPEAKKPDDWDEDAPREIPDEEATKPEGWLDDEPDEVEDPQAEQPSDWDNEEDGDWEAPLVPNPKCAEAPGCGEWQRPNKPNPEYKGKWYPPLIDNPAYKGVWKPRKIANPKFFEDKTPLKSIGSIGAVALEIWTMSKGLVVDNVLVGADEATAGELEKTAWKPKYDFIKTVADAAEEKKKKEREAEAKKAEKDAAAARSVPQRVTDALYAAIDALPEAAKPVTDALRKGVDYLAENDYATYGFVALVASLVLVTLVGALFPAREEKVDEVAVAKKEDKTGADDEAEEEEEAEEENEEEEQPKSAAKRRTRRS